MNSKDYATLALNIQSHWGGDLPLPEALRMADKLIYHQRRLSMVNGEKEIEKILAKCRELTGTLWEEDQGRLLGAFTVPN